MGGYGNQFFGASGNSISASSIPENVRGGNIDWNTVSPAATDQTVLDDIQIKAGEKFLRYGAIIVKITEGDSKGMFGPFDRNATDGRQKLENGGAYILDRAVRKSEEDTDVVKLFDRGTVFKARLLVGEENNPNHPTWEEFNNAFKGIRLISD